MRNFNILEVHRKIRVLGRGFMKKPIYREDYLEWGGGGGVGRKGGAGLKITVGHRTMSDQIRKLSDQTENIPYILSNRKI